MNSSQHQTVLGREPTLVLQTINLILQAVQISAISMSALGHTIVACVIVAVTAVLNRQAVTPNAKLKP